MKESEPASSPSTSDRKRTSLVLISFAVVLFVEGVVLTYAGLAPRSDDYLSAAFELESSALSTTTSVALAFGVAFLIADALVLRGALAPEPKASVPALLLNADTAEMRASC